MGVVTVALSRYRDESYSSVARRGSLLSSGASVFAEVVVDIPARELADKLFTYRIPDYLQSETFIGAQVLVPFGHQDLVGGYVVAVRDHYSGNYVAKEIVDVIDQDPLFDPPYIDFLYWVSEYYCTSICSVISAAVPADFGPRLKRVVELKRQDSDLYCKGAPDIFEDKSVAKVLEALLESGGKALSLRTLRQKSGLTQPSFYRAVAILRQSNAVSVRALNEGQLAPKLVTTIAWSGREGESARQEAIIAVLRRAGGQMPLAQLVKDAGTTRDTIKRMIASGILHERQEEILRDPMSRVPTMQATDSIIPTLTDCQRAVMERLSRELSIILNAAQQTESEPKPYLLHGVTGSGKTEVYLRLIAETLDAGRSALLLVPEISLTPQLAKRLKSRFGARVAIWHSALSAGERYDTWRRIRAGDVSVLLGARSAILTSMPKLGLIILDEEHDGSYKQSSPDPRYHTCRLACEKARRLGAMVLLGSATPDVCTYHNAVISNRLLELPERVHKQALPPVTIVDMRHEFASGNRSIFSRLLLSALTKCLAAQQQAILLLNRRGYASHVFCRACGFVLKCDHCSVSLVLHQGEARGKYACEDGRLACHHCGFTSPATTTCPSCRSPFLRQYGLGTQRVEQELKADFPDARLLRLDADTVGKKGAYEKVYETFAGGHADILIGTQMVAKGLDIPKVTLVGVLAADASFNVPDYRSLERGFQLLTQVSGRAGRGAEPGTVILQTYDTELPALKLASSHDYNSFVQAELKIRQELVYPPFSQIIRVVVSGPDQIQVESACHQLAEELTNHLEEAIPPDAVRILGPASCLIERLRGQFRYHILVKNLAGEVGHLLVTGFLRGKRPKNNVQMTVDVDPFDLI